MHRASFEGNGMKLTLLISQKAPKRQNWTSLRFTAGCSMFGNGQCPHVWPLGSRHLWRWKTRSFNCFTMTLQTYSHGMGACWIARCNFHIYPCYCIVIVSVPMLKERLWSWQRFCPRGKRERKAGGDEKKEKEGERRRKEEEVKSWRTGERWEDQSGESPLRSWDKSRESDGSLPAQPPTITLSDVQPGNDLPLEVWETKGFQDLSSKIRRFLKKLL